MNSCGIVHLRKTIAVWSMILKKLSAGLFGFEKLSVVSFKCLISPLESLECVLQKVKKSLQKVLMYVTQTQVFNTSIYSKLKTSDKCS